MGDWLARTAFTIPADLVGSDTVAPFVHLVSPTRLVVIFRGSGTADGAVLYGWGGSIDEVTGDVTMDSLADLITVALLASNEFPDRVWALPDGGYYVRTFLSGA